MTRLVSLLRRELLEHRTSILWTQLGISAAVALLCLLLASATFNLQFDSTSDLTHNSTDLNIEMGTGQGIAAGDLISQILQHLDNSSLEYRQQLIRGVRATISWIFQFVLYLVLFSYLLASLYTERADRSVLFWKSMPVSDWMSVLSKLLTALLIAPAVALIAIQVTQLLLLLMASVFAWSGGFSAWQLLWLPADMVSAFFGLVLAYLVQALWLLPIVAWLMLVSAWSKRSPFLLALLGPLVPIGLEGALFQTHTIGSSIGRHLSWTVLPPPDSFNDQGLHQSTTLTDSLSYLWSADLWSGVAAGVLLLAITVYVRRRKNEI